MAATRPVNLWTTRVSRLGSCAGDGGVPAAGRRPQPKRRRIGRMNIAITTVPRAMATRGNPAVPIYSWAPVFIKTSARAAGFAMARISPRESDFTGRLPRGQAGHGVRTGGSRMLFIAGSRICSISPFLRRVYPRRFYFAPGNCAPLIHGSELFSMRTAGQGQPALPKKSGRGVPPARPKPLRRGEGPTAPSGAI